MSAKPPRIRRLVLWPCLLTIASVAGCSSRGRVRSLEQENQAQLARIAELEQALERERLRADSALTVYAQAQAASAEALDSLSMLTAHLEALEASIIQPAPRWPFINFDYDDASLDQEATQTLTQFVHFMKQKPNLRLGLIGRADPRGSEIYNFKLSNRRAENARNFLLSFGIEPWRLDVVAAGETSPLLTGESEEAYAENRSVQPVILDAGEPVEVTSVPARARVYFFKVGEEWDQHKGHLDDAAAIAPFRVNEGPTNTTTYRERTWYHVMFVLDGRKRFRCDVQILRSNPNNISVVFDNTPDDKPCR